MTDSHKETLRQLIVFASEVDHLTVETFEEIAKDDSADVIPALKQAEKYTEDLAEEHGIGEPDWGFGTLSFHARRNELLDTD